LNYEALDDVLLDDPASQNPEPPDTDPVLDCTNRLLEYDVAEISMAVTHFHSSPTPDVN